MLIEVFKNTILITGFVLVIMLIIEYVNVRSHGNWHNKLGSNRWLQYIMAAMLGIIPGCVGAFAVVSMYMHSIISFGALVAALITTFGDEAFVMFRLMPLVTFKLVGILLAIALVTAFVVDYFFKNKAIIPPIGAHFQIHEHEPETSIFNVKKILKNIRYTGLMRAILMLAMLLLLVGIATGYFNHAHPQVSNHEIEHQSHNIHHQNCETEQHQPHWEWEQLVFFLLVSFGFVIIVGVSDHFLNDHLWDHVLKKHFLRILLWTFGALLFIEIFNEYLHWQDWIKDNHLIVLLLAVLIGVIPESGPHLIFVTLYMQGTIPFSILLSSALVQDGHGALPLLAESKKSFFLAKTINITIGLIVGLLGYFLGF